MTAIFLAFARHTVTVAPPEAQTLYHVTASFNRQYTHLLLSFFLSFFYLRRGSCGELLASLKRVELAFIAPLAPLDSVGSVETAPVVLLALLFHWLCWLWLAPFAYVGSVQSASWGPLTSAVLN